MKILKENILIILIFGMIFLSWFASEINLSDLIDFATAQTSSQVNVTANVLATVSCNAAPATTSFGSIDSSNI